ncbi:hypothetical protein Tco_0313389 [Tanacetum coccineum]
MNQIVAQKTALDNALVAPDDRKSWKSICNNSSSSFPRLKTHLHTSSNMTRKSAELMWKSFKIFSRSVLDFIIKSLMNLLLMRKLSHSSRNLATKEIPDLLSRCLQTTCTNLGEPLLPSSINVFRGKPQDTYISSSDTSEVSLHYSAYDIGGGGTNKDTPGVSVSKKKAPAKAERNEGIVLLSEAALLMEAGGSGDGAGLEPEVPDEQKGKSIDTHEGIGLKPRVPDVSKADSSESEYESWGVSDDDDDDDDDDDKQGDDKRTESDDDKSVDLNKTYSEKETQEDEFVHTPEDYVPTDDETNDVDNEEYRKIKEEIVRILILFNQLNIS